MNPLAMIFPSGPNNIRSPPRIRKIPTSDFVIKPCGQGLCNFSKAVKAIDRGLHNHSQYFETISVIFPDVA